MTFNPITPVLVIRNISKSDVNILGVKIRPGQQKDIYQELEYDENGSLTTTVLKELETPNGKIYRLWKVLDVIRIIQCVNPTHFGSGLTPDSITASNAYFEGAVLGYENGEFKWLSGGGGGGVSAVTASSPLASSGGSTPNLTIGGGTPGQVLTSDGGTSPTWEDLPAPPAADWTRTGTVLSPTAAGDTVSVEIPFGTVGLVVEESAAAFRTSVSPAVVTLEDNLKRAELNANSASLTLKGDTAEAVAPAIVAQDETGSPYALDLQMLELAVNGDVGAAGQVLTSGGPGAAPTWTAASSDFAYDQEVFVAKNGSDVTGTGSVLNPFASVGAAMAAITDSSPSKRYAIRVEAGAYTESSALNIKPDVYIIGALKDAVRITAPSFGLDALFTGAGDKRSGVAQAILIGTCAFNMTSVTSNEGKLSFHGVSFNSPISITGFTGTNQAQFDSCLFFGAISFSGVNVGSFVNNRCFTSISLSQHPSLPTILNAAGGFADSLTATAAVNNFSRRCSVFARSMKFDGTVTVDGPSAYFDYTVCSLPQAGPVSLNGGNLVSVDWGANKELSNLVFPTKVNNPIIPASTNATNHGDWGYQWFWNFGYLHASTGTDCYLVSYPSAFGAETDAGKNVYLVADAAGLAADIDGGGVGMYSSNASGTGDSGPIVAETGTAVDGYSGDITLTTGSVSGTGTRGVISLNGRHINANSTKIANLADGTDPSDAVNKGQLDALATTSSFLVPAAVKYDFPGAAGPTVIDPVAPPTATGSTFTVGTLGGEDFTDLATALADSSVVNGSRLLLSAQEFTLTSQLNIGKQVIIQGAGRSSTTIKTTGLGTGVFYMLNITTSNVVLRDMTISDLRAAPTSNDSAINISAGAGSSGHYLENVVVNFGEFGVIIKSDGWQINNCHIAYVGPNNATRRGIGIYRSAGQGLFTNSTYDSGQNGVITGNTRLIAIVTGAAPPDEVLGGYLRIGNITPSNAFPIHQFFNCEYFAPAATPLTFCVDGCTAAETSAFVVFANAVTQPVLSQCQEIVFQNNTFTNAHGKGGFALNGATGGPASPGITTFYASGNTISSTGFLGNFATAIDGSADPAVLAQMGYDTLRWTDPNQTVSAVSSGLAGLLTVDGVSLSDGERVFVVDASDGINSGIYIASASEWARSADFDDGKNARGTFFFVNKGDVYSNTAWLCTNTDGLDVVATDALTFEQFGNTAGNDPDAIVISLNTSTNAVVAGEAVCADSAAARTVKKADVSALATARVIGIAVGDGKVQTAGIALAKFTSAPSIGDAAYLSATTGQLTGTAPVSGIEAEVGIVVDNVAVDGKYAVALQIKKPV